MVQRHKQQQKQTLSLSDWEQRQMLTNHSKNINITAMDERGSVERQNNDNNEIRNLTS